MRASVTPAGRTGRRSQTGRRGCRSRTCRSCAPIGRTRYDWRRLEARLNAIAAVPDRDRRGRDPLPPRALARAGCAAAAADPRLARVGRRVPRRSSGRWPIRSRTAATPPTPFTSSCPSLPGYGFSDKPSASGWDVDRDRARLGRAHEPARLQPLRRAGRRLGRVVTTRLGGRRLASTCRHPPEHARRRLARSIAAVGEPTADEQAALAGAASYRRSGTGYSTPAVDPAADARLRPRRFAGRPVRLDRREVPRLDRQRRDIRSRSSPVTSCSTTSCCTGCPGPAPLRRGSTGRACAIRRARDPVDVPTGCSIFPKELFQVSRRWAEQRFSDLRYFRRLDRGGHFAAFEQPELFVDEVRQFFRTVR